MSFAKSTPRNVAGIVGLCAVALGAVGFASAPALAQPVVQALPNPATERLNDALRGLARNPNSLPLLITAGQASVELDDYDAARGFFLRAQAISSGDGRVLTGLAMVAVRREDPVAAISLFEQAQRAGQDMTAYGAEFGLAYDLVGNNALAQRWYGVALSRNDNPETVRRLALSHAIAGDRAASEAVLLPLLQRRDLAAYRTRAFALAILGKEDEAISIVETMLPGRLAQRLSPYLRFMPRLTRAQQAAAANLGSFPPAAQIGRDNPQIASAAGSAPAPAASQTANRSADSRLIPSGQAMGPSSTRRSGTTRREVVQQVPRATTPAPAARQEDVQELPPAIASREATQELPPVSSPTTAPAPTANTRREVVQALPPQTSRPDPAAPVVVARLPEPEPEQQVAQPSFSISEPVAGPPVDARVREPLQIDLAQAFAEFEIEAAPPAPRNLDAVDITKIEPRREERAPAPPPAPPPPPPHPSRIWVQVATGQDISAFRFDWRRLVRNAGGLLDGRKAYRAAWNQTNRLVTGPFASNSEAQDFVTALSEKGVDSFRFTSASGEEVVALD